MGLEKAIRSGKERRKEYHGAKAVDSACRNNGGCPYCESNRLYVNRKRLIAAEEQFRECEFERKIFSKEAFEVMEHPVSWLAVPILGSRMALLMLPTCRMSLMQMWKVRMLPMK